MSAHTIQAANDNRGGSADETKQKKLEWFIARAQECMMALIKNSDPSFRQTEATTDGNEGTDVQVLYKYKVGFLDLSEGIELGVCEVELGGVVITVQAMIPADLDDISGWFFSLTVEDAELQALWDDDGTCLIAPAVIV